MRLVAALLPAKIRHLIPRSTPAPISRLGLETLLSRPSLHQRPIHAEVFITQQPRGPRLFQHPMKEPLGHISRYQPVPGSCRTRLHPRLRRPSAAPQTNGTAGCNPSAPLTVARFVSCTTPAVITPVTAAP